MKKLILLLLILFTLCSCSPFLDWFGFGSQTEISAPSWLSGSWGTSDDSLLFNFDDSSFSIKIDDKNMSSSDLGKLGCKITEELKSDGSYLIELKMLGAKYDFVFNDPDEEPYILLTINQNGSEMLFSGRLYRK